MIFFKCQNGGFMASNVLTIPTTSVFVPSSLGNISVKYENHDFCVIDSNGSKATIQRADLDKEIRGVSQETLQKMLEVGFLTLNKSQGDYILKYSVRGPGGFILSGVAVFFTTYGTGLAMCVAGTALAATGVGGVAGAYLITAGATTMGVAAPLAAAAT